MSYTVTSPTPGAYVVCERDSAWDATWTVFQYDGKARRNGNDGWFCYSCGKIRDPHTEAAKQYWRQR